ncbi:MAG: hypothetical protein LQ351_001847 [Letrouitia transgressa]|nr:MAG: hypothetical protein LQ351_001847 [Letrouitia transgressa]
MTTSKPHSVRKRMISNVYSKSYLQSSQEVTEITQTMLLDRLLPLLDRSSSAKTPVEIHEVNFAVAMDFISSYLFGLSNNSNFIEDVPMRRNFMNWYFKRTENTYWTREFPQLKHLLVRFGIHLIPTSVDEANTEIEAWVLRLCKLAERSLASFSQSANAAHQTTPVVYKQLKGSLQILRTKPTDPGGQHPSSPVDLHTASEMLDQLAAGMDTSGVTLTYLFWNLCRNPDIQSSLQKELTLLSPPIHLDSHSLPPARALDTLPLLHAVIMETLRLHPAVPGLQPRITPTMPVSLASSPPLPGGIRVSAQAYSLHRNPDVFPHPEQWNPRRWLDSTKEQKDEMMRWFWAFSSGGRMCIGSNFAMQELKYVTTAVYTNFSTKIVDDTGIEQLDCYTGGPRGHQLTLSFERA